MIRRVAPWLTPLLAAVEITLACTGRLGWRAALAAGLAVEALLWAAALRGIVAGVRRFRAGRASGVGRWQAAEDGLAQLVPRPVARVILVEPRLWVCLVRWVSGRYPHAGGQAFRYDASLRPVIWVVTALVAVEGVVVDTLLAVCLPGSVWVWVSIGLHAYALLGLLGFLASWITRPHLLEEHVLLVRDGVLTELTVPYTAIVEATVAIRPNFGRSGLTIDGTSALLALGDANVRLTVEPAHTGVTTLALTADEPREFVQALRLRMGDPANLVATHAPVHLHCAACYHSAAESATHPTWPAPTHLH